jgi:hypothetical protein
MEPDMSFVFTPSIPRLVALRAAVAPFKGRVKTNAKTARVCYPAASWDEEQITTTIIALENAGACRVGGGHLTHHSFSFAGGIMSVFVQFKA